MYPVLFRIGGVSVDTYYTVWFIALSSAVLWALRRFPLYGIDDDEGRRVLGWGFIGMLVGTRLWNFSRYWPNPLLFLDLNSGGVSEVGAVSGAFVTVFFLCWRNPKISFGGLCGAVISPALFALTLGRWGCFFAGCCAGISSAFPTALHFPYDPPSLHRHPTQIYYSLTAAAILALLLFAERQIIKRRGSPHTLQGCAVSLPAPLGLILYTAMRLSIDPLRETAGEGTAFLLSHSVLITGLPFEAAWLAAAWRAFRKSA